MAAQTCCICTDASVDPGASTSLSGFPPTEQLWEGGDFKFLGSEIRYKKIAFLYFQIYEVALYVETDAAKKEIQRLKDDGFFKDYSEDSLCAAINAGVFRKLLQIQLLRNVTAKQFRDELSRDLEPRLRRTGDEGQLGPFFDYFQDKSLSKNSSLLALWEENNVLTGGLFPPDFSDFASAKVDIGLDSEAFCRALFDVYIGPGTIVPTARAQWAEAVLDLLTT